MFQGLPGEALLEAATRNNHAAIRLRIARMAREAGDEAGASETIEHAEASLQRSAEIARQTGDARLAAFVDTFASETALMRGEAAAAAAQLQCAIEHADEAGSTSHSRFLRVTQAEAFNTAAAPAPPPASMPRPCCTPRRRAGSSKACCASNCARSRASCAHGSSSNTCIATAPARAGASLRASAP